MEQLRRLFFSYISSILGIFFINHVNKMIPVIVLLVTDYKYSLEHWFDTSIKIFLFGLVVFGSITLIISFIYNMVLFFYYAFFSQFDKLIKMEVMIDENDIIRESFMEYKNGKKIPVNIKRIYINQLPPQQTVTNEQIQEQEENKDNE